VPPLKRLKASNHPNPSLLQMMTPPRQLVAVKSRTTMVKPIDFDFSGSKLKNRLNNN